MELKVWCNSASELNIAKEMILHGSRIIIPQKMRDEILRKIHGGHFGVNKFRARAREAYGGRKCPMISQFLLENAVFGK